MSCMLFWNSFSSLLVVLVSIRSLFLDQFPFCMFSRVLLDLRCNYAAFSIFQVVVFQDVLVFFFFKSCRLFWVVLGCSI